MRGRPPRSALFPYATVFRSQALSRSFTTTANGSGQIVIAFTQGGADNPFIGGIEILSTNAATPIPSTATATPTSGSGEAPYGGTPPAAPRNTARRTGRGRA